MEKEIEIRPYMPDDQNYILSTWLRSYHEQSPFAKSMRTRIYFEYHEKVAKRILERSDAVIVACLPDDPGVILGYLVHERDQKLGNILHFCFVKGAFRGEKISRLLFRQAGIINTTEAFFTHKIFAMEWVTEKYPGLTYNPYLI